MPLEPTPPQKMTLMRCDLGMLMSAILLMESVLSLSALDSGVLRKLKSSLAWLSWSCSVVVCRSFATLASGNGNVPPKRSGV